MGSPGYAIYGEHSHPLLAKIRLARGFLEQDAFCSNCFYYLSEHTPENLCLFSPTRYEAETREQWRQRRIGWFK